MRACHSRSIYFVIYFIVYINCTPTYVVTNEAIKRYSAHALLLPRLHTLLLRKVIERSIPRFIAGKSALYFRLNRTRGLFLSIYLILLLILTCSSRTRADCSFDSIKTRIRKQTCSSRTRADCSRRCREVIERINPRFKALQVRLICRRSAPPIPL